eukprot:jgi/Ulvmu1/10188/UM006_0144.1
MHTADFCFQAWDEPCDVRHCDLHRRPWQSCAWCTTQILASRDAKAASWQHAGNQNTSMYARAHSTTAQFHPSGWTTGGNRWRQLLTVIDFFSATVGRHAGFMHNAAAWADRVTH